MTGSLDHFFVFLQRNLQYGVPVANVVEIIETPELQPTHAEIPGFLGVIEHRGRLLPVLDPTWLGCPTRRGDDLPRFVIVVKEGLIFFALTMDQVVSVSPIEATEAATELPENRYALRITSFQKKFLLWLAIPALAELVHRSFGQAQRERSLEAVNPIKESPQLDFVCARLETMRLAIHVDRVNEVIEGYAVTPLFRMPPLVRGVLNLRGDVLVCLDISPGLGLPPRLIDERNQFVILSSEDEAIALCVDQVLGIQRLAVDRFQNAKTSLPAPLNEHLTGVLEAEEGPIYELSVSAILASPVLQPFRRREA
jgi:purine-binding chemotaxis protein CheW